MSIVRDNLMNERGYTPYCGAEKCDLHWPRTRFNGSQFACRCGFETTFEPEFIAAYKAKWNVGKWCTHCERTNHDTSECGSARPANVIGGGTTLGIGLAMAASVMGAEAVYGSMPRLPRARQAPTPDPERQSAAQAKRDRKAAKRLRDAGAQA